MWSQGKISRFTLSTPKMLNKKQGCLFLQTYSMGGKCISAYSQLLFCACVCARAAAEGPSWVYNWLRKKKCKECLNKSSLYQNLFILDKCLRPGHHPASKNKRWSRGFFFLVLGIVLRRSKMELWGWDSCRLIKERWMCFSHEQHSNTNAIKTHLCRYTPLIWKSLFKLVLLARFAQLLPYRKCQGCKTEACAKYEVHDCSVLIRTWKLHINKEKRHYFRIEGKKGKKANFQFIALTLIITYWDYYYKWHLKHLHIYICNNQVK